MLGIKQKAAKQITITALEIPVFSVYSYLA
jgi:hypothetical protein